MDISYVTENQRFNYRVAAVIIADNHVLLNQNEGDDYWYLPGVRVQMMESGEEAVKRELQEEIKAEVKVGELLWFVENFFAYEQHHFHEIGLYYKVTIEDESVIDRARSLFTISEYGRQYVFQWFPIDGLEHINIQPSFLKEGLKDIPSHTRHIIRR
jgi:ADP-ribose pyrophosphatase YjhB (NUDIX family)